MKDIVITTGDGRELKGLYQWDINQKICISGIETSPPPEIHFWACRLSKALVVPAQVHGDKVIADVPNILLQVAEPITIFIYKRTGEDGHRTSDAVLCPVRARPQPEEYEYQDNIEYTSWVELTEEARELIDQIDEIVSSMSGIADRALAYATSAGDSASSANTAKLAAELAQGKAEDAQAASELAQGKAEDAQEAAEAVLESIPEDYSELSSDVVDLKSSLKTTVDAISEENVNVVDKNALTKLNAYIKPAGSIATQSNTRVCYFKCLPDTEYVVSKMLSARFRVGYTTQIPANNVTVSGFVADNDATSLTIATGSNALYAVVYYYDGANDTLTEDEIFDSLEITYGKETTAVDKIARANGLSDDIKDALLTCFRNVAWINDHGQDYYDALEASLYTPDPHVGPVSISADYTQSHTVYDTDSLDGLKADLVVRATYSDGTVKAISDYVLSGALTVGTSVITVEYNGVTTTFEVTVTDFYNNWVWDSATDSAMKQKGSAATQYDRGNSEGDYRYSPAITTNHARRCFVVDRGRANTNVCNSSGVLVTDQYLIPVPPTATKATFTISPSTQYCALRPWVYDTGNGKWKRGTDGGWKQGTGTITFDSGENKYISINCKPTSDGNTAYNGTTLPYPSVRIEFE